MTTLGVGIVGAGVVGRMRAETIRREPATRLVAMTDVDLDRARQVAGSADVAVAADSRAIADDPRVDLAIVASPVQHHEEAVLALLDAGKHVLVEKPLSNSVESCQRMVDAASRAGRTLAVGFNHRFYPSFRTLRRIVDEGSLGPVDHIRAFGGHEGMSQFRAAWAYEKATLGGGAMMDVGIHVSDLVAYLGFRARDVSAAVSNGIWNVPGSEDNAMVVGRTADGVPINYHASWSEWKGYRLRVEVYGRDGAALAFYPPLLNLVSRPPGRPGKRRTWTLYPTLNVREKLRGWETTATQAFADELTEVLRLLRGEPALCATGADGLYAVAFATAAVRSSENGQFVRLDQS